MNLFYISEALKQPISLLIYKLLFSLFNLIIFMIYSMYFVYFHLHDGGPNIELIVLHA